ncbi:hypothetical protein DAPPUDRAFT_320293 [Daphnia pulex]|uniref:RING-type domain-containing protein n=1 Tax=Daphnia pulex TaxID=6669 RepID=E9GPG1_DAPPU|nr:hypothetical protein DAPPUDRAFT_320293 [Daphnia pulex]|eukprot:EFX78635.1 hypothetical protein DAPPUDRAFT_320293 [Daphnia pulex]
MSSKEIRIVEELLPRENDEMSKEVGALKRMKEEEYDGRVAELKERERGKDEGFRLLLGKCHQLETEVRVLRNKEMDFFQCDEPSKECYLSRCRKSNFLITCQAIHEGANCKEFQVQVNQSAETDEDVSRRTEEMIDALVDSCEALSCPQCQVVNIGAAIAWVRCSVCRTEICWVTKQNRWGPNAQWAKVTRAQGDSQSKMLCGCSNLLGSRPIPYD